MTALEISWLRGIAAISALVRRAQLLIAATVRAAPIAAITHAKKLPITISTIPNAQIAGIQDGAVSGISSVAGPGFEGVAIVGSGLG